MSITMGSLYRAKQGDAGAITALINDALQLQDVWAKTALNNDCLQVMLKSSAMLSQPDCIAFIRRGLLRLQPEMIHHVTTYAWRAGDAFPLWIATFSLEQVPLPQNQPAVLAERSLEVTHSMVPSAAKAVQTAPTLALPLAAVPKQRSDFFKLGFVVVLVAMVYLVVAGV